MIAPACPHENYKHHGHDRYGNQRYRCTLCGATWIDRQPKALGDMRIPLDKAAMCLKMLLEGTSIRSTERLTGINRNTILNLLELVGQRAQLFWQTRMRGIAAQSVQCDEVWGFVYCKEKARLRNAWIGLSDQCGDAWTFLGIERDTKLILAYHLGRREPEDTAWFTDKLRQATTGRFQVNTDGFKPYCTAIPESFHGSVDFAQLVKIYGSPPEASQGRYSPAEIKGIRKRVMWGHPNMDEVSTSFSERFNLTVRMGVRRMTRLTNAFSKKWECLAPLGIGILRWPG